MNQSLIEIDNLTKKYNNCIALDKVHIKLEKGEIYGLVGKNGAGKTTLMRMIAGLSIPTSGHIILFGQSKGKGLQIARKKIGCMIENPSIVPYLTGKENLQLQQRLRGIKKSNCEVELKLVGLSAKDKKKAKDYSLGMKQRLGIAIALLGNPEVVILDEPINGLDPVGVTEIRDLLINLCKNRNLTILVSSHNLPEMNQVATQYIFIDNGKIIKAMSTEQLDRESRHHLLIGCNQMTNLTEVLKNVLHTNNFKVFSDDKIMLYDFLDNIEHVSKMLIENGIVATTFYYQEETLENYFLTLIGGGKYDRFN